MNPDQDRMLKIALQTLHDGWVSMGELAWVLLGVLLLVGIVVLAASLRWIWSGGLSRQTGFGLLHHHRIVDELLSGDS